MSEGGVTEGTWMQEFVGGCTGGRVFRTYVSAAGGFMKSCVEVPPVTGMDVSQLAAVFRVAAGVAARGGYTVTRSDGASTPSSPVAPGGYAPEESKFWGHGEAGRSLARIDSAVSRRKAAEAEPVKITNGTCYLSVIRQGKEAEAVQRLVEWPTLGAVTSLPEDVYASEEVLRSVGVSFRGTSLHLGRGDGWGEISFHDLLSAVRYAATVPGQLTSLLSVRVGGDVPECEGDCRATTLRALGLKRLVVCGRNFSELRGQRGGPQFWNTLFHEGAGALPRVTGGNDGTPFAAGLSEAGTEGVCPCWWEPQTEPGRSECSQCHFLVAPDGHEERCGDKKKWNIGALRSELAEAWVGDALHVLDVRSVLLQHGPYDAVVRDQVKYTSARGQAEYCMSRLNRSFETEAAASRWFEANYASLRVNYISWLRDHLSAHADLGFRPNVFVRPAHTYGKSCAGTCYCGLQVYGGPEYQAASIELGGRLGSGVTKGEEHSYSWLGQDLSGTCLCETVGTAAVVAVSKAVCPRHSAPGSLSSLKEAGYGRSTLSRAFDEVIDRAYPKLPKGVFPSKDGMLSSVRASGFANCGLEQFKEKLGALAGGCKSTFALLTLCVVAREVASLSRKDQVLLFWQCGAKVEGVRIAVTDSSD